MTAKIRTFRYVRHTDMSAYLELGWTAPEPNCPHPQMDRYGVTMEWPHARPLVEPMGQFEAAAFLRDLRWDRGEIEPFRSIGDIANRIVDKLVEERKKEADEVFSKCMVDLYASGKSLVKIGKDGVKHLPPDEWEDYERAAEDEQRRQDARDGFDD